MLAFLSHLKLKTAGMAQNDIFIGKTHNCRNSEWLNWIS